jgi:hypothetical protein
MRAALMRAELYRGYARDCYRFANETNDVVAKNALLVMARAWVRLADQADKNSRQDLVYETPSPRPPDQSS